MDGLIIAAAFLVVIPALYTYVASIIQMRFPILKNKRVCLLIAHPDDEAMFFAPTILSLARPETGNHVKILCLSTGNAAGLGATRRQELFKSALTLGLRQEEDVFVIDSSEFPDSMNVTWDADRVAALLSEAFVPPKTSKRRSDDEPPVASIDVLITFDGQGVSSHPNHISLYNGAHTFLRNLVRGRPGWRSPVDLYTLTSVSFVRKYTGFLDVFSTLASWGTGVVRSSTPREPQHPPSLVFANQLVGAGGWPTAMSAMTSAHKSQMVWFRWGWIVFSRYMVLNDLRLEKIRR